MLTVTDVPPTVPVTFKCDLTNWTYDLRDNVYTALATIPCNGATTTLNLAPGAYNQNAGYGFNTEFTVNADGTITENGDPASVFSANGSGITIRGVDVLVKNDLDPHYVM